MEIQHFVVTSGLPGSGKSTVAEGVARALGATILSVDPIEAAMWTSGIARDSTGVASYRVAAALAAENLKQGQSVVVDAVNPVEESRALWKGLAARFGLDVCFVECVCSDRDIHRKRVQRRVRNIEGMSEVTWEQVENRRLEYHLWTTPRLVLDTAHGSPEKLVQLVLHKLRTE